MVSAIAFLVSAVGLATLAWRWRRRRAGYICVNGAAVLVALAGFEAYRSLRAGDENPAQIEGSIRDGFTRRDALLGYAPIAGKSVTMRKLQGEEILFDVVYSIDAHGLRISPPSSPKPEGCVLFFGDSSTFGEGVNDTETFPYLVGLRTGGRYRIYNFAFIGYGPHQMLASLQAGNVERTIDCTPTHAVYLLGPSHIARVAGLTTWDISGPRFRLSQTGSVFRDGRFDDPPSFLRGLPLSRDLSYALAEWPPWRTMLGRQRAENTADVDLMLAVIAESARVVAERFPQARLHIVLGSEGAGPILAPVGKALEARHIAVHRATDFMPALAGPEWRRYVIPHDGHPNTLHHGHLADLVIQQVLGR